MLRESPDFYHDVYVVSSHIHGHIANCQPYACDFCGDVVTELVRIPDPYCDPYHVVSYLLICPSCWEIVKVAK